MIHPCYRRLRRRQRVIGLPRLRCRTSRSARSVARLVRIPLLAFGIWASVHDSADAELRLCDRTSYVLYAAVAIQEPAAIATRGWTRLVPGDCANVIEGPLKAPAYFIYARSPKSSSDPSRFWGGQFRFCAREENFSLRMPLGAANCTAGGAFAPSFAAIPTGGAQSWTTTLTESGKFATPDDARLAGLRRYLAALGYPPGTDPMSTGAGVARFRETAKLPRTASWSDVFAALEARTKAAPPQGYSICNDGTTDIWAAVGLKSGRDFESRGWWNVRAGSCATAIAEPLGQAVYLYASKHGNSRLVSGPETFCISDAIFDIRGRERCVAHGSAAIGFLATNLGGLPRFVAHVDDVGLADVQSPTLK